jgi:hypothetical protein
MEVQRFAVALPGPAPRPARPVRMRLEPGVLSATQRALRAASANRREAIVLWAGRPLAGSTVLISHLLCPLFESGPRHLVLPQAERAVIADYLRRERLLAFADLHTHPFEAFLSAADRARPFSSRDGFFAAVIPNFANQRARAGWRFYCAQRGYWQEVQGKEAVDGWGD